MRISSNGLPEIIPTGNASTDKVRGATPAPATGAASTYTPAAASDKPLQTAGMQEAMSALAEMPEIDQARVDAMRDAIAKGEIRFDANKLAGLITRYHGGRG